MKFKLRNRNSIALRLMATVTTFGVLLSVLWIVLLLAGGILSNTKANAYEFFSEKVSNRRNYIETELKNRRENIKPAIAELSKALEILGSSHIPTKENQTLFFSRATPILTSILRTTASTGAFLILNDNITRKSVHSALYLRDYDPYLNDATSLDEKDNDIYMAVGPSELAREMGIPLDTFWDYTLTLNEANRDFYYVPYENSQKSANADFLGYFSRVFSLTPDDAPIITYSIPLFDQKGVVRGIAGIELSVAFLNSLLPAEELNPLDSLGYIFGISTEDSASIQPISMENAFQARILSLDMPFQLKRKDLSRDIFQIENTKASVNLFACVKELELYPYQTPYNQEHWYLIGMLEDNALLRFYHNIFNVLLLTSAICILLTLGFGVFISYRFSKPIRSLAKRVRISDLANITDLGKTGISEIDDLSVAIESVSRNLLDTAAKMSQIIELVNVPIGAFEYRTDTSFVFATDKLWKILSWNPERTLVLSNNKDLFVEKLNLIMEYPEPGEENVYRINDALPKWVKIETVTSQNTTIGIATDVTEEISKKNLIKRERDYDALTGLRARVHFQECVERLLAQMAPDTVCAMLMLDLDLFKQINDRFGHDTGDDYLRQTAKLLREMEDGRLLSGRRSGDEFFLFFHHWESQDAIRMQVDSMYRRFQESPFLFPDGTCKVIAFSSGICWFGQTASDYETLMHFADAALYKAKYQATGTCFENQSKS